MVLAGGVDVAAHVVHRKLLSARIIPGTFSRELPSAYPKADKRRQGSGAAGQRRTDSAQRAGGRKSRNVAAQPEYRARPATPQRARAARHHTHPDAPDATGLALTHSLTTHSPSPSAPLPPGRPPKPPPACCLLLRRRPQSPPVWPVRTAPTTRGARFSRASTSPRRPRDFSHRYLHDAGSFIKSERFLSLRSPPTPHRPLFRAAFRMWRGRERPHDARRRSRAHLAVEAGRALVSRTPRNPYSRKEREQAKRMNR